MGEDKRKGILPIPENMANWRAHRRKWANVVWWIRTHGVRASEVTMINACGRASDSAGCSACTERDVRADEAGQPAFCSYCPIDWMSSMTPAAAPCCDNGADFHEFLRQFSIHKDAEAALALARKIRDAKWKPRPRRKR